MSDPVRMAVDDRVAVITFDRPAQLNAFTPAMHRRYRECLADADADEGVGAIVVTGAGRGFCAGADLAAVSGVATTGRPPDATSGSGARPGYGVHADFDRPFAYHLGLSSPVIAAINGPAAGLGMVLACYCDVRFAAAGATLTPGFGALGLPAEYGLSWILPRLIGGSRAVELLLSSRRVTAGEAAEMGLVHRVVDPAELVAAACAYARELVERCPPAARTATKRQVYLDLQRSLGAAYDDATARTASAVRGEEFRAAVAARTARTAPPTA